MSEESKEHGTVEASTVSDRERWDADQRRVDRDLQLRERDLEMKDREARRSRLWNPLAIAILGAAIAASGNAYVSRVNSDAAIAVETFKAESARIFEVVKTGNPDLAAKNLGFLMETGLIQNKETVANIVKYLDRRKTGEGVALPSAASATPTDCAPMASNMVDSAKVTIVCGISAAQVAELVRLAASANKTAK